MKSILVDPGPRRGLAALATLIAMAGGMPAKVRPRLPDEPIPHPPGAPRPKGFSWVRHAGQRQKLRLIRQNWRRALKLKDPVSEAAWNALRGAVAMEPDPEYGEMHLAHAAMLDADRTGAPWAESVLFLLTTFEENAKEAGAA